ncbi:hypothetical protein HOF78_01100 [Candidatus Woesearchaeota archaeon]|jgi:hypothetical protein|nr:hypothetical protein [Candidatus Woesearchaeota archaeon]MBT6045017.1 hypothetical protein [Candidatus Woesearchaeota archaeon]
MLSKFSFRKWLILLIVGLIIVILASFIYNKSNIIGYEEYPVTYSVGGGYIGINLSPGEINFGTTPTGYMFSRSINISTDLDSEVLVYSQGIDYLTITEEDFYLPAGESREVGLLLQVPEGHPEGIYKGKLIVVIKKA